MGTVWQLLKNYAAQIDENFAKRGVVPRGAFVFDTKKDKGTTSEQYDFQNMNDLVKRVSKLEELHELVIKNQKEILLGIKSFQDGARTQFSELRGMMAATIKGKGPMEGSFMQEGESQGCKEMTLSEKDQAIIRQYEVACNASVCPTDLALDKIEVALRKILSSSVDGSLEGCFKGQESQMNCGSAHPTPKAFRSFPPHARNTAQKAKKTFTPLSFSYKEMYSILYEADLVRPTFVTPFKPSYPAWYDVNAHCEYHDGVMGHSIENCIVFKKVVQNLINTGVLKID